MLESDAIKFDQFLRDNEAQVNAAIRDAEGEAKKRQDRQVRPLRPAHIHQFPALLVHNCTREYGQQIKRDQLQHLDSISRNPWRSGRTTSLTVAQHLV